MTTTAKIACTVNTTDSSVPLGLEIWVDNECVLNTDHVTDTVKFSHTISDDDGEHSLKFVMKNKTSAHTQVDTAGNITKDAQLTISDLSFDEIELGQIFYETAEYQHDFNGSGNTVVEQCFGVMGCNGTVTMPFSTPIYIWLLEHM